MKIDIGLSNYYGTVHAVERGGKYFLTLGDYGGMDEVEISEELFRAIEKEFVTREEQK